MAESSTRDLEWMTKASWRLSPSTFELIFVLAEAVQPTTNKKLKNLSSDQRKNGAVSAF